MATRIVRLDGSDISLEVLPDIGARLHRLTVRGHDLLRTPDDPRLHSRDPFFWGGFVMAPWCNRIRPERTQVEGRTVDLEPNFRDGTAIHGQVYAAEWQQTGDTAFAIERGGGTWPWRYRVEMDYAIEALRLTVTQRLVNLADGPMPGGIGLHPWFVAEPELSIASSLVYPSNTDSIPRPEPVSGDLDMRSRRQLPEGVDAAWADATQPELELWWPGQGLHATLRAPAQHAHVVAANPVDVDAIAVEPQTHAPDGLRRLLNSEPGALQLIAPGEALELRIEIEFESV